jgi:hypothetical protein
VSGCWLCPVNAWHAIEAASMSFRRFGMRSYS